MTGGSTACSFPSKYNPREGIPCLKARWLLSAGAFVFAAPAFAQPTQDTVPTQESPTEEGAVDRTGESRRAEGSIVVTAQGRAQRLRTCRWPCPRSARSSCKIAARPIFAR
jgi:hypothetical protein